MAGSHVNFYGGQRRPARSLPSLRSLPWLVFCRLVALLLDEAAHRPVKGRLMPRPHKQVGGAAFDVGAYRGG